MIVPVLTHSWQKICYDIVLAESKDFFGLKLATALPSDSVLYEPPKVNYLALAFIYKFMEVSTICLKHVM